MNYTIVSLETYGGEFSMSLDTSGSKYVVGIHDKESGVYRSRTFDRLKDAQQKFLTLAGWCCQGLYSFKDRVEYLTK